MTKRKNLFWAAMFFALLLAVSAVPSKAWADGGADKTANFHATITAQQDTWSSGVTATVSVNYMLDQRSINQGDYIIISIPQNIVSEVDWGVSSQHFSKVEDLGGGRYKLVFGADGQTALSGAFAMNLTMKNDTDMAQSGTISIGGASKTMTVNPRSSSSGTSGTETRAIVKDINESDVGFGDYDYSDGQDNAKQIGIIKASTDGVYTYRVFVNPKKTTMSNIMVTDKLPGGMHFKSDSSPTVEYYESAGAAAIVNPELYQLTCTSGEMTFTYPGVLNRCIEISYKVSVDDTKNSKYTNSASIDYTENGKAYSEQSGYVLQGTNYSAVNGEKQVNKTEITNANQDQQVMYAFKFWNDKTTSAGAINFTDTLDARVRFDGAVSSDYFSITQDTQNPQKIHITNTKDLPGNKTFYARFFVNMSAVPAGSTVMNTAGGNTVYTTKKAEVKLTATKTLNGQAPGNNTYEFELCDSTGKVLQTKENGTDGRIDFDPIEYGIDDVGKTFDYTVREKQGSDTKTTYDSSVYQVSVKVAQAGKDQPITTTTTIVKKGQKDQPGQSVESMTFANSQELAPAAASITAVKNLSGRALKNGEFRFTLNAQDKAPMPTGAKDGKLTVKNNGAAVDFGSITYDKAGTYNYTIQEEKGSLGGVTYDGSTKTVKVTVADRGDGTLSATVDGAGSSATFKNTYAPKPIATTLSADKVLTGRTLKDGEFSFTISATAGTPMPDKTTTVNKADGTIDFGKVTFDQAGTYTYAIKENGGQVKGVTYDGSVKNIVAEVTDDGNGQLQVKVTGTGKAATFKNIYQATSSAVIKGQKTVNGKASGKLDGFTFTLTPINAQGVGIGGQPMKAVTAADGSFAFDAIQYELNDVGTYYYLLDEANLPQGYLKDFQPQRIKVKVSDNGDGTLKTVIADIPQNGLTLNNTYKTTHVTPIVPAAGKEVKTDDTTNTIGWMILALAASVGLVMINRKREINK